MIPSWPVRKDADVVYRVLIAAGLHGDGFVLATDWHLVDVDVLGCSNLTDDLGLTKKSDKLKPGRLYLCEGNARSSRGFEDLYEEWSYVGKVRELKVGEITDELMDMTPPETPEESDVEDAEAAGP